MRHVKAEIRVRPGLVLTETTTGKELLGCSTSAAFGHSVNGLVPIALEVHLRFQREQFEGLLSISPTQGHSPVWLAPLP